MVAPSARVGGSPKKFHKKIDWHTLEHYAFLSHMAFAIIKGYRKYNTLDKERWDLVINRLRDENEINVDFATLKNHYDKGRKLWQGWNELKGFTGLGWNELTNTFVCPNFIKRHKDCKRLEELGV